MIPLFGILNSQMFESNLCILKSVVKTVIKGCTIEHQFDCKNDKNMNISEKLASKEKEMSLP